MFSSSLLDSYSASGFPGLTDLLYKYDELTPDGKTQRDKDIRKHISDLTIVINRAISAIKNYHIIE